jgi:hypothetical protein
LGNFARAQQDYQLARSASLSDDLIIRQAISLSLAGQSANADGMLLPLLQRNNGAAWRARAFMLAARGDTRESTKVAEGFMDARSAQKMERYLRLMPDLTTAQQAAAIHLGHFPANNIGRDSENIRRVAATISAPMPPKNESRLIPTGEPLGKKAGQEKLVKERLARRRERVGLQQPATPAPATTPPEPPKIATLDRNGLATDRARNMVEGAKVATVAVAKVTEMPPPEAARPLVNVALPNNTPPPLTQQSAPAPVVVTQQVPIATTIAAVELPARPAVETPLGLANEAQAVPMQPTTAAIQGPSESGAPLTQTNVVFVPTVQPAVVEANSSQAAAAPVTNPLFDLAAIVGAIDIPESEQEPSAIAVDLKRLRALTSKPAVAEPLKGTKPDLKSAAKALTTANPARFWVQIATGEASALGYDYRRWAKKNAGLFKEQSGWTSAWAKTDRLLVGPFADLKTSKKWEADFRKAGGSGFAWKSENGVVVNALRGK